jgi:phenylalanyl-tRNA synthetase beta chain
MAANLVVEICGSESTEVSQIVEAGSCEFIQPEIEFDLSQIKQIIGIEIEKNFVLRTLKDLGFKVQELSGNLLKVQVPSHRNDVRISQDLVEEIIRVYGLNKITPVPLLVDNAGFIAKSPLEIVRDKLVNFGFIETINYSFVDEKLAALFAEILPELKLHNPIAAQMNYMRPNLLIGLLQNVAKNQTRGFFDLALFETGRIFLKVEPNQQKNSVAGVRVGKNKVHNHYKDERFFDVFDVKKDLFASLESLGFSASSFMLSDEVPNYYHPHRSKAVKLGKNIVGYFGELHPIIAKKLDVKINLGGVNIFELFVDELPINLNKKTNKKSFEISDLLPVNRDFAFILDAQVAVGDLLKAVASVDKNLITEVNLFDIYHDKKLGEDKKSIAFSIKIQPLEKTLTGEEIEAVSQKIIGEVEKKFGGLLRG